MAREGTGAAGASGDPGAPGAGGDIIIAPANTWHNFANVGDGLLRHTAIHAAKDFATEYPRNTGD